MSVATRELPSPDHDGETVPRALHDAARQELEAAQRYSAELEQQIFQLRIEEAKLLTVSDLLSRCANDETITAAERAYRACVIHEYARHLLGEVGE